MHKIVKSTEKEYYENNKENLQEKVQNWSRNLSEEVKKKREYSRNKHKNMSEEDKTKTKGIWKKLPKCKKKVIIKNWFLLRIS